MKPTGNLSLRRFCVLLLMMVSYTDTYVVAAPKGGRVVSGTATFQQDGNLTVITAGNKSIINYGSFNIGAGETVRFVQPGANSSVLNRVVGSANPTEIFGTLQANGRVFIINPYGIFFQNGSVINVGSLYAGAGNLSDADFAKGKIKFTDLAGDVRNDGIIAADNRIALMGANVVNTGSVNALKGMAMMVSGKDVYVGAKDGNIFVQANGKSQAGMPVKPSSGSIANSGTVAAPRVLIGGGDIYSTAISNSGLLQGHSVTVNAGRNGTATVGGKIDATSAAPGATADRKGGSIQVLGGNVALKSATLDASGKAGGGSVRIGGDFHGDGALAHSETTIVDSATTIKADATGKSGDGGTVVLWSDKLTSYTGKISVDAGGKSGDGGQVEVSSHGQLGFDGGMTADAPGGKAGSLLLDPTNIDITADGTGATTTTGTIAPGAPGDPVTTTTITARSLENLGPGVTIDLEATQDIRIEDLAIRLDQTLPTTNSGLLNLAAGTAGAAGTVTFRAGVGGTGSFVMVGAAPRTVPIVAVPTAVPADTIVAPGRNLTITASGPTATNGINGGSANAIAVGNLNTSSTVRAGGTVNLTLTGTAQLPAAPVQIYSVNSSSTAGAGGSVTVGGVTAAVLPTAISFGSATANVINTTGSTTAGNINLTTTTGGTITFAAGPTFTGNTALTTGTISGGTLNGGGFNLSVTQTTPFLLNTVATNSVRDFLSDGAGGTNINVASFTTSGNQTYNNAITLSANATLTSTGVNTITIGGGLDSSATAGVTDAHTLSIATRGFTQINAPLGRTFALGSFSTDFQNVSSDVLFFNVTGGLPAVTTINNGTAAAPGTQTYGEPVRLSADTTLVSNFSGPATAGGTITFQNGVATSTLTAGQAFALGITNTGTTTFNFASPANPGIGVGGAAAPLSSLSTGTGTTNFNGTAVTTNGTLGQKYNGPLVLGGAGVATLTAGAGPVNFTNTVSGTTAGAQGLAISTTGTTTFSNTVGTTAIPLASVSTGSGANILNGASVTTNGTAGQVYNGPVTLGPASNSTTLAAGTGPINFVSTVEGSAANTQALVLTTSGAQTLGGAVGATNALASLVTGTGGVGINGGVVRTNGAQTYNGPVTLAVAGASAATPLTTTLTALTAANITFNGTVNGDIAGAEALVVNSPGNEVFVGNVGSNGALASLTTDNGGSLGGNAVLGATATNPAFSVTTTGAQTYRDPVLLGANTTLSAGSLDLTGSSINGAASATTGYNLTLTIGASITISGGTATGVAANPSRPLGLLNNINNFVSNGSGTTGFSGDFETYGSQTFATPVRLGGNRSLRSDNGGDISFLAVDSAVGTHNSLSIFTGGATIFGGQVGASDPLASLTTDVGGTTVFNYAGAGNAVQTINDLPSGNGAQTYNDAVTLTQNTVLQATGGGAIGFGNTVNGPGALTLNTTGATSFGGVVGGSTRLASLTVATGGTGTAFGPTVTSINTAGFQTFGSPITLGVGLTLSTTNPDATAGAITFGSTISGGGFNLITSTLGGNTIFGAGSGSVAGSLLNNLTTSANGSTIFNDAAFTTTGTQNYQGAAVVQSATRALSLTSTAGNIIFGGPLTSTAALSTDLTVTASAAGASVTFTGPVGGGTTSPSATALNSLTVTSPTININGGVVNTASTMPRLTPNDGVQIYNGNVLLGANTTFVGTTVTSTGSLAINGQGNDLTLTLSGLVTVPLAGFTNIKNFTSNGSGGTRISTNAPGTFTTTGFQHYDNPTTLGSNSILVAGAGGFEFGANPSGTPFTLTSPTTAFALTLTTTGPVVFNGVVGGGGAPLAALNITNGAGTISLNGGAITTTGLQNYGGPVSLTAATTTLTSTNGEIDFPFAVNAQSAGGQALVINTPSAAATANSVVFSNTVGSLTLPLASLNVNGTGIGRINGGSIFTTGGQSYQVPVTIGAATTTLTSTSNGPLFFGGTLSNTAAGTPTLTLSTGGTTTLNGAVGSNAVAGSGPLGNFAVTGGGPIKVNGGSVLSTGSQNYNGPLAVGVAATTTFTSTGNAIQFASTLDGTADGAQSVTVNASGNEVFSSPVGSLVRLQNLTTDAVAGAGQAQFSFNLASFPGAVAGVNVTGNVAINDAPGAGGGVLFGVQGSTIGRPTVFSGGSQTYANGGSATQKTVLVGGGLLTTGGTFNFNGNDLQARFGQLVTINSALGGVANFISDGAGGTLVNGPFTTTATQYYGNNVTLLNNPTLTAVGSVLFTSKVDGNSLLTVNVTGTDSQVIFNGLVGDTTTLTGLNVTTAGTTASSGTRFNMAAGTSTLNRGGVNVGATGVTINGPVFFNETGSTLTTADHPSVVSVGPQFYNGAATLQMNTGLLATGAASAITFGTANTANGTIDGPASLAVSTLGNEVFNGLIGSTTVLTGLATDTLFPAAAPTATNEAQFTFTLGGAQAGVRVNGAVTLNDEARFTVDGSTLTQPSVLTFGNGAQTYAKPVILAAQTVFTSTAGAPTDPAFTGGGQITFGYTSPTVASVASATATRQNLYVRTGVGQTQLGGSVDATSLDLGGARATFAGNVGPVGIFSVRANPTPGNAVGSIRIGGTFTTTGPQIFSDDVILFAPTVLNSTGVGAGITFNGRVDSDLLTAPGAFSLTLNTAGLTIFRGPVGSTGPLASLTTDFAGAGDLGTQFNIDLTAFPAAVAGVRVVGAVTINDPVVFNVGGSTLARPTIQTGVNGGVGSQFYARAATLQADTVLTDLGTGNITFGAAGTNNGTVDGAFNLAVNTGGDEVFNSLVGSFVPLASLTTDATGTVSGAARFNMNLAPAGAVAGVRVSGLLDIHDNVVFNAANNGGTLPAIQTGGAQTYRGTATLAQNTILTSTAAGTLSFLSTVNSDALATPRTLTLNTAGLTSFNGLIGNVAPLASLTTDFQNAPGENTQFNIDLGLFPAAVAGVRVVGAVTINDPVVFNVGGSTLARPTIQTGVNGGVGAQFYARAALLQRDTVLTDLGTGNITFGAVNTPNGTVDGAFNLFVNTGGDEVFNGLVGSGIQLAGLQTDAAGTPAGSARFNMSLASPGTVAGVRVSGLVDIHDNVVFNATGNGGAVPAIQTGGAQTYRVAATLAQNTILDSVGSGNISFLGSVDGGFDLTVKTAGATIFNGLIGSATPLASLTTDLRNPSDAGTQFNVDLTTFPAAVAGVRVAGAVTINDPVTFNVNGSVNPTRPTIQTGVNGGAGSQFYNLATTLSQNTVLTDVSGGTIRFGATGTATGTINGTFDLFVNTGGLTIFNGAVGGTAPLGSLTTDLPGTTQINGRVINTVRMGVFTGTQTYNDAVLLGQDTTLTSNKLGNVVFNNRLDGGFRLDVNTAGLTLFNGLIGSTAPLASLTTDNQGLVGEGTQFNIDLTAFPAAVAGVRVVNGLTVNDPVFFNVNGSVNPTRPTVQTGIGGAGSQSYNSTATLARNTVLTDLSGGNIRFGTIDPLTGKIIGGTINGTFDLFVNTGGLTIFNGAVGGVVPLGSLTTDAPGTTQLNGGIVNTVHTGTFSGTQTYNDAVLLGQNTTLTSTFAAPATAGGNLLFTSTVDGAFTLTLNTGGLTRFDNLVGSATPLTGLTTDKTGAAGELTQFNIGLSGTARAGVIVNGPLTVNDPVLFTITGANVTQPGILTLNNADQVYGDAVRLGTNTYLTSAATLPALIGAPFTGGGGIFFTSTAGISSAGGSDLVIRAGVGVTRFDSTINVGSLDLGGAKATFHGPVTLPGLLSVVPNDSSPVGSILLAGGGLTTSGAQTFRVGVLLGADTVLTSLNTAGDGGNITFLSTVDSDPTGPARALTLNTTGDEIFNGLVGSIGALASLTTDDPGPVGGSAIFNMPLTGTPAGTAGANVNGAVTINDKVVFNVAGSSLADNTHPTILTGGSQTYNGAATLLQDTALVSSGGGTIQFSTTLDGTFNLALTSTGNEIFNGLVGRTAALASLATDTFGTPSGQARFNMDTLGTGPGVNVVGTVTINDGVLFNATNVALTAANQPTILSGGTQTYNGPAFLGQNTVLTSSAGSLVFNATLDSNPGGSFGLGTNSGALHVFNGLVGSATPLASLTTNGGGTQFNMAVLGTTAPAGVRISGPLTINGTTLFSVDGSSTAQPTVLTLGAAAQTYNGAVTLARGTVLTASGGGDLVFASTVDGSSVNNVSTLALNTKGLTTFNGAVGGSVPLTSLRTDEDPNTLGGTTILNGGTVTTVGFQDYNDSVTLLKNTVLTSTNAGTLRFHSTLNGDPANPATGFTLALNSAGDEVFNANVGGTAPLLSLTTDASANVRGGSTIFSLPNGVAGPLTVTTTGAQAYNDSITLRSPVTLTTGAAGSVTTGTITGPGFDLTVNTGTGVFGAINAGILRFNLGGAGTFSQLTGTDMFFNVGGLTTFNGTITGNNLTVAPLGGQVQLNGGSVITTGFQNFGEPVTLGSPTLLQAGSSINVASLNGGGSAPKSGFTLTLTAASTTFGTITNVGDLLWTVAGATTLNGSVAANSLRLNGGATGPGNSTLALNGGTVSTNDDQIYNAQITLGTTTTLTASNGGARIKLGPLLGKRFSLTVNVASAIFDTVSNVLDLDVAAANATVNGGSIATVGHQLYRGNLALGADTTLTSQGDRSASASLNAIQVNGSVAGGGQGFHVVVGNGQNANFQKITGTGATTFAVQGRTFLDDDVTASSVFVGGGQQLVLNTASVRTGGDQTYSQPVLLGDESGAQKGGAVTLVSDRNGIVTFDRTVDVNSSGARALTVATLGEVHFNGAVGQDTAPLTSLRVTTDPSDLGIGSGEQSHTFVRGGSIYTNQEQIYDGLVSTDADDAGGTTLFNSGLSEVVFNRTVAADAGNLTVRADRIRLRENGTAAGNLNLTAGASGNLNIAGSLPVLRLDGTIYSSTNGTITLNGVTNPNYPTNSQYSTIVLTSGDTVNFRAQNFVMGNLQKLYANGALNIDVGRGQATVGDLAASTTIRVIAGQVTLLNREPKTVTGFGTDSGLTFAAGTSISFGTARILYADARNQTASFVTTNGVTTIQRRTGLSIFRNPNLREQFRFTNAFQERDEQFGLLTFQIPVQPIGGGSQTLDTAAALSGALPDQKPLDIPVDVNITASQMEELRKLGINPRKATKSEYGSSKRALFAQLVDSKDTENYGRLQPIKGGVSQLVPSEYVVVVDRMSEREVQTILKAFEDLYGKDKAKAPTIGAAYQKAYDDYTVEKQTDKPDGFAPFLKAKAGKYPDVDSAARGFDNLFGYIEHMGLTSVEVTKAEGHIVSDLGMNNPSSDDMVKVINDQRKALPPAQKAASTKVPPAPPMVSPGPAVSPAPSPGAPPAPKKVDPLKTVQEGQPMPAWLTTFQVVPVETNASFVETAGL